MKWLLLLLMTGLLPLSGYSEGTCDANEKLAIESNIIEALNDYRKWYDISTWHPFTLLVGNTHGSKLVVSVGDSTADTAYESASTAKMVTGAVILRLIDQGHLSLSDKPIDSISFWHRYRYRRSKLDDVELRHILNFTAGLNAENLCIYNKSVSFKDCVKKIYNWNKFTGVVAGTYQSYSNTSQQVAGLMAMNALGESRWADVFNRFKAETGTFNNSVYSIPSIESPLLAGGMVWTGNDYFDFLKKYYEGKLFSSSHLLSAESELVKITKGIGVSPIKKIIGQDWRYGYGFWLECNVEVPLEYNCAGVTRISSPGAYGAYPFIDYPKGLYGILSIKAGMGGDPEGYKIVESIQPLLNQWASCQ